jgi:hypothetical protein
MRETDRADLPRRVDGHLGDRRDGHVPDRERYYFSAGGSVASEGAREHAEDARARESGEKPWRT